MAVETQEQPVNLDRRRFIGGAIALLVGSALFGHGFGRFVEGLILDDTARARAEREVRVHNIYPPKVEHLQEAKDTLMRLPKDRDPEKAQTAEAVMKQQSDYKDGVNMRKNQIMAEQGYSYFRRGVDITEAAVGLFQEGWG